MGVVGGVAGGAVGGISNFAPSPLWPSLLGVVPGCVCQQSRAAWRGRCGIVALLNNRYRYHWLLPFTEIDRSGANAEIDNEHAAKIIY